MKKKMDKQKKIIILVLALLLVVSALVLIYKYIQYVEHKKLVAEQEAYKVQRACEYEQFKELFYQQNDNMQVVVDELQKEELHETEDIYIFLGNDSELRQVITFVPNYPIICYYNKEFSCDSNEDIIRNINENDVLKDALNEIEESRIIKGILAKKTDSSERYEFEIYKEFMTFIPENYLDANRFIYSEKDLDEYVFVNVEDNWYMYIPGVMTE